MEKISIKKLTMTRIAAEEKHREAVVNVLKIVLQTHRLWDSIVVCPASEEGKYEVVAGRFLLEAWNELEMGENILCEIVEPQPIHVSDIAVFSDVNGLRRLLVWKEFRPDEAIWAAVL